jgi:hypothetical protein
MKKLFRDHVTKGEAIIWRGKCSREEEKVRRLTEPVCIGGMQPRGTTKRVVQVTIVKSVIGNGGAVAATRMTTMCD